MTIRQAILSTLVTILCGHEGIWSLPSPKYALRNYTDTFNVMQIKRQEFVEPCSYTNVCVYEFYTLLMCAVQCTAVVRGQPMAVMGKS